MARKPRIHYYGAINHVIARGNNKESIFLDNADKLKYLKLLKRYKEKFDFQIFAYALMENHIHLLVEVKDIPLSRIMQGIQLSYTLYFNKKYDRVGHVFQQRYKSKLCDREEYLVTLIKYIHTNPMKAGLCPTLHYDWSSHKDYIVANNDLVTTSFVLNLFGVNGINSVNNYIAYMDINEDDASEDLAGIDGPDEHRAGGPMVERQYPHFQPHLHKSRLSNNMLGNNNSTIEIDITVDDLIKLIASKMGITKEMIFDKCKTRQITRARKTLMYLAVSNGLLTKGSAAKLFKMSHSTATRAVNEIVHNEKSRAEAEEFFKHINSEASTQTPKLQEPGLLNCTCEGLTPNCTIAQNKA